MVSPWDPQKPKCPSYATMGMGRRHRNNRKKPSRVVIIARDVVGIERRRDERPSSIRGGLGVGVVSVNANANGHHRHALWHTSNHAYTRRQSHIVAPEGLRRVNNASGASLMTVDARRSSADPLLVSRCESNGRPFIRRSARIVVVVIVDESRSEVVVQANF